ncbi:hypothetical protein SCLCIDRAFT_26713 [Scleroderma citrinum Foug A]|uniref:Uncharacterized protein n=1 Tax=Scleroderma citrinum Foug A TaxID=1036808 RepID=A0A0C3DI41_9AGAM|nr:hypothetical protein SCLCIDRAFT_26713 [Scleroderma citrinum Foug A]
MFCHFTGIGVGHKIQYPIQAGSGVPHVDNECNSEGDEELDLDDEGDCTSTGGCGMDDMIVDQAGISWNLEENDSEKDDLEFGTASEAKYEHKFEDSEVDLEDDNGATSDDEDARF